MKKISIAVSILVIALVIYVVAAVYNSGPSENSVKHEITKLSSRPDNIKDWLHSKQISFSATKAPNTLKNNDPGNSTVYTLKQFGFTDSDLANASEILDFSIWTRQEFTLGRPFLRYLLIYDSSGDLLFERSVKFYEFL